MFYVIKSTYSLPSKKEPGKMIEITSYFQKRNVRVFVFDSFTTKIEEAKKYDFLSEARREKRKYFGNRKGISIEKIQAKTT